MTDEITTAFDIVLWTLLYMSPGALALLGHTRHLLERRAKGWIVVLCFLFATHVVGGIAIAIAFTVSGASGNVYWQTAMSFGLIEPVMLWLWAACARPSPATDAERRRIDWLFLLLALASAVLTTTFLFVATNDNTLANYTPAGMSIVTLAGVTALCCIRIYDSSAAAARKKQRAAGLGAAQVMVGI